MLLITGCSDDNCPTCPSEPSTGITVYWADPRIPGWVYAWHLDQPNAPDSFAVPVYTTYHLAWSPENRALLVSDGQSEITAYAVDDATVVTRFEFGGSLAPSPDDRFIVVEGDSTWFLDNSTLTVIAADTLPCRAGSFNSTSMTYTAIAYDTLVVEYTIDSTVTRTRTIDFGWFEPLRYILPDESSDYLLAVTRPQSSDYGGDLFQIHADSTVAHYRGLLRNPQAIVAPAPGLNKWLLTDPFLPGIPAQVYRGYVQEIEIGVLGSFFAITTAIPPYGFVDSVTPADSFLSNPAYPERGSSDSLIAIGNGPGHTAGVLLLDKVDGLYVGYNFQSFDSLADDLVNTSAVTTFVDEN